MEEKKNLLPAMPEVAGQTSLQKVHDEHVQRADMVAEKVRANIAKVNGKIESEAIAEAFAKMHKKVNDHEKAIKEERLQATKYLDGLKKVLMTPEKALQAVSDELKSMRNTWEEEKAEKAREEARKAEEERRKKEAFAQAVAGAKIKYDTHVSSWQAKINEAGKQLATEGKTDEIKAKIEGAEATANKFFDFVTKEYIDTEGDLAQAIWDKLLPNGQEAEMTRLKELYSDLWAVWLEVAEKKGEGADEVEEAVKADIESKSEEALQEIKEQHEMAIAEAGFEQQMKAQSGANKTAKGTRTTYEVQVSNPMAYSNLLAYYIANNGDLKKLEKVLFTTLLKKERPQIEGVSYIEKKSVSAR